MKKLHHPNIVEIYEVINDEKDQFIYIVMEYLSGGSILSQQNSKGLLESQAKSYFVDIARGLEYRS